VKRPSAARTPRTVSSPNVGCVPYVVVVGETASGTVVEVVPAPQAAAVMKPAMTTAIVRIHSNVLESPNGGDIFGRAE